MASNASSLPGAQSAEGGTAERDLNNAPSATVAAPPKQDNSTDTGIKGDNGSVSSKSSSTAASSDNVSSATTGSTAESSGTEVGYGVGSSQFVDRVKKLPVVKCAAGVYDAAATYPVVATSVSIVKIVVVMAASPAVLICSPIARLCSAPIRSVDWLLCKGLDVVESVLPCIAVPPDQMMAATKKCAADCVCCRMASCAASTLLSTADKMRECYSQRI